MRGPGVAAPYQHAALALRLLHEQHAGAQSQFAPYLASLPTEDSLRQFYLPMWHFEQQQEQQSSQQEQRKQQEQHRPPHQREQHHRLQHEYRQPHEYQAAQGVAPTMVTSLLSASPSASTAFSQQWGKLLWEHAHVVPHLCGCAPPLRWWLHKADAHACAGAPAPPHPPVPRGPDEDVVSHAGCRLSAVPSLARYLWARAIVATRAIRLWSGGWQIF